MIRSDWSLSPRNPAARGRASTTMTSPEPAKMISRHAHSRQNR